MNKHYTLVVSYQFTSFERVYEKTKSKEFHSDNLTELVNILNQYVNGFMSKEKKEDCWIYFSAEIRNNKLLSYDTEYVVWEISMERRD